MSSIDDLMNGAKDFEIPESITEDSAPSFSFQNYDLVKLAVVSIEPRREEIEALGEVADPVAAAPWQSGILLRLLALQVKRREAQDLTDPSSPEVLKVFDLVDYSGGIDKIEFKYSPFGLRQFEQLRRDDIDRGYLRIYNDEGRTSKVMGYEPSDFENASPQERFAFWWKMISRKFGVTKGLQPGDVFSVLTKLSYSKKKNADGTPKYKNPFNNFQKSMKHMEKQSHIEAPSGIEHIEVPVLRAISMKIEDIYAEYQAKRDAASSEVPF